MTINATSYQPQTYAAAGLGPYEFTFECLEDTVFVQVDGEDTQLGFTIQLNGDGPVFQGGSVTFLELPPVGSIITIGRDTGQDQGIDYQTYTRFPAQTHELALDKLTLITQENRYLTGTGGDDPSGDFLPLAGGTMDPGAAINWSAPGTGGTGRLTYASVLGVPAFVMQPLPGGLSQGYVFQIDDALTKYLAAAVDGTWSIEGRPDFASLPDNAVATKADVQTGGGQFLPLSGGTMDPGAFITFQNGLANAFAEINYQNVFGVPAWSFQPADLSPDSGFVFAIKRDLTSYLAGDADGVWAIEGRPDFATLPDNAIALKIDIDTGGGQFLPLGGGTLNDDSFINWGTAATSGEARMGLISTLGVPGFVIQPLSAAPDMGFVFQIDDAQTKFMAAAVDGEWTIVGRPDFALLSDDAIATKRDVQTGGGQFFPLAGGTLDLEAKIIFQTTGGGGALTELTLGGLLGVPAFSIQPQVGSPDQGYVFAVDTGITKTLAGAVDGQWSITGRPTFDLIADNAIALKEDVNTRISRAGDTWDEGVTQVFPNSASAPDSSDAELAFINFFGINALRIQAATASTTLGIGYLFLTDQQDVATAFMVGSKTDGWRVRNQLFADPDNLVTVNYLQTNTTGLAPSDGTEYVQKDGAWVPNTGGSGGEVNTNSNAGAGVGLVLPKVGVDTPIKTILEGANITITEQADTITIAASGALGATWGSITGTLSDQTDLQSELDAKFNKAGDTWGEDVEQLFTKPATLPSTSGGSMQFTAVLGIPTFFWGPQDVGGTEEVGYLLATSIAPGPVLGGSVSAGFSVANQVLASDDSIITRGLGDGRYAALVHTHTIAQINGLQAELNDLQAQINLKAPLSASNTAVWGQITGTLANQTDLQNALNGKANSSNTVTTNTIQAITANKTFDSQVTIDGGLTGGLIVTGSGAGFSIDATGIILGRAGFNSNNQRIVAVATPQTGTDAANQNYVDGAVANKADDNAVVKLTGNQIANGQKTWNDFNQFNGGVTFAAGGGSVFMGGGANMNNEKVTFLAPPTGGTDAVNLNYLQNNYTANTANEVVTGLWDFTNGTTVSGSAVLSGGAIMGNTRIQGLADPQVGSDAANRTFVEAQASDIRLKDILHHDIQSERIYDLELFAYEWRRDVTTLVDKACFRPGVHYGTSAQGMQETIPEGVYPSALEGDYLDIDRDMLLMMALRELQKHEIRLEELT